MDFAAHLQGVWAALLTPLTDDRGIDLDALHKHAGGLVEAGVHGVVPLGTTGEFCEFAAGERAEILRVTVEAVAGRVPVLAGVTGLSLVQTLRHIDDAREMGADAVLVLPPLYWKLDESGLYDYFAEIATVSSLPVVAYDYPALTAQKIPVSVLRRLAAEQPNVVGVKLTVRDLFEITSVLAAVKAERPGFRVVTGFEDLLPAALHAGADGAISGMANFCPDLLLEIHREVRGSGQRLPAALAELTKLFGVYQLSAPPILALKAATEATGRPVRARVRAPGGEVAAVRDAVTGLLGGRAW
jgi:4-hydroxy-tetrahydrodipicolinate synthase